MDCHVIKPRAFLEPDEKSLVVRLFPVNDLAVIAALDTWCGCSGTMSRGWRAMASDVREESEFYNGK
jgi:hypothetical protein